MFYWIILGQNLTRVLMKLHVFVWKKTGLPGWENGIRDVGTRESNSVQCKKWVVYLFKLIDFY